jgi:hypothetical protein
MLETIITSVATAIVTGLITFSAQERKLKSELRTEFMAEQVARALLEDERWKKRSFSAIKKRLGGFEDNELRKILVRAGAIRFESKDDEYWGLLSKNRNDI